MERLTGRKSEVIRHVRALGRDRDARRAAGEFVCAGRKLLREARTWGAEITAVLWGEEPAEEGIAAPQYLLPGELLDYVSPLQNAGGVVFTVRTRPWAPAPPGRAVVLETVQDPGNLGTVLRTANAFGFDTVLLTGDCADVYNPKTVRAAMGAVFRQRFYEMERGAVRDYLSGHGLHLYGASLDSGARAVGSISLDGAAVAIGSEGRGLSPEMLALCDGTVIIPMRESCESLNAAVAAAIVMWEATRELRI